MQAGGGKLAYVDREDGAGIRLACGIKYGVEKGMRSVVSLIRMCRSDNLTLRPCLGFFMLGSRYPGS